MKRGSDLVLPAVGGRPVVTFCDIDDDADDGGFLASVDLCLTLEADICPCHILAPLERRTPFEEEFADADVGADVDVGAGVSDGFRW